MSVVKCPNGNAILGIDYQSVQNVFKNKINHSKTSASSYAP